MDFVDECKQEFRFIYSDIFTIQVTIKFVIVSFS